MKKIIITLLGFLGCFSVFAQNPQISISEDSLNFVLPRGLTLTQDLMISNIGNDLLNVSISEELPANAKQPANALNKVVVINDSIGDTNDPSIDVVQVDVTRISGMFGVTTTFEITFAAPPNSGTLGTISIDMDQEFGTGVFPAPFGFNLPFYDIGSEIEVIFDVGNNFIDTLGLGPIAVALSADDSSVVGLAQIQIQGNVATAAFLPFFGGAAFDESFNLAATFISFSGLAFPDNAPDYGHGTFGTEIPISWISALPQQFSVAPGDSFQIPVRFVSVNEPGSYTANLNFNSNDPTHPVKTVKLNFEILGILQPDIFLPVTVIDDTIDNIFDSTGVFLIENHGLGELIFALTDSLPGNEEWLVLPTRAGMVTTGSLISIPYYISADTLQPGNDYTGYIKILSNDPDEKLIDLQLNVHINGSSFIANPDIVPETTELKQNFPNPFNPSTKIPYSLAKAGHVEIAIYNMLGQKVYELVNKNQPAGHYTVPWSGQNNIGKSVASGVYIYQLKTENNFLRKKMLYIR